MKRAFFLIILLCFALYAMANGTDGARSVSTSTCHTFKPHFQGNIEIKGLGTGHWLQSKNLSAPNMRFEDLPAGGPGFDVILGSRVKEWCFIGGGVSLNWWLNSEAKCYFPLTDKSLSTHGWGYAIYVAPRFYLPLKNKNVTPYFDGGIGFTQFFRMVEGFNQYQLDIYGHAGLGIDIHRFNISAGYQYSYSHNGYLRVGYRF